MNYKHTFPGTYRKAIAFYYPDTDILDKMGKETAYRIKVLMDAGENVPQGMAFHPQDDAQWFAQEAPRAITKIAQPYVRLMHGLKGPGVLGAALTFQQVKSTVININDYNQYTPALVDWFDGALEKLLISELAMRWFAEKDLQAALKHYALEYALMESQAKIRSDEFYKRKAAQMTYTTTDRTIYAGFFSSAPIPGQLVPENLQVPATISGDKITVEYPVGQVGYPVLMVPESMAPYLSWYMTPENYGPIGGSPDDVPSNLFPYPVDILLDGDKTYKAYIANYATEIDRAMTFLTTVIE